MFVFLYGFKYLFYKYSKRILVRESKGRFISFWVKAISVVVINMLL